MNTTVNVETKKIGQEFHNHKNSKCVNNTIKWLKTFTFSHNLFWIIALILLTN